MSAGGPIPSSSCAISPRYLGRCWQELGTSCDRSVLVQCAVQQQGRSALLLHRHAFVDTLLLVRQAVLVVLVPPAQLPVERLHRYCPFSRKPQLRRARLDTLAAGQEKFQIRFGTFFPPHSDACICSREHARIPNYVLPRGMEGALVMVAACESCLSTNRAADRAIHGHCRIRDCLDH